MNLDFSNKEIPFLRVHFIGFILSLALVVLSFFSFFYSGLNFGIDFKGGTLIEIETEDNVGIAEVRKTLSELSLGDVQIQEFGSKNDILIRVEEQFGGDKAQQNVVGIVKNQLNNKISLATIYNTVHAFEKKGYLKQIPINSSEAYFDTNVTDHHHFYDLNEDKLIDLENSDVGPINILKKINGKKIKSVEVLVKLED